MNIIEAIQKLEDQFPVFDFSGGETDEGFWIRAVDSRMDWVWYRSRMLTVEFAYDECVRALS